MSRLLDLDAVTEVLEKAFRLLECAVSGSCDKQRVSFVIFEPNGNQDLECNEPGQPEMRDPHSLRLTIDRVRSHLGWRDLASTPGNRQRDLSSRGML